ncbi:MAG: bifunctional hydroxymethylpyrimidine kinase/phosphomethylpyrimidine kinase [Candidatus Promineifilaceae bacterium]|nr:bifunctional hydroxymethylpyrimidine kinase/phosphomethylpyrimidine kinase [Candidatus Promineifilaceae bacterium]
MSEGAHQPSLVRTSAHAFLTAAFLTAQLDAVFVDYRPVAVKTGFLGVAELVKAVAERLAHYRPAHIVIDPVLVNHRGQPMFGPEVTDAYRRDLLPLADLVTPNLAEAALLLDRPLDGLDQAEATARALLQWGPTWVLLKGRGRAEAVTDLLTDDRQTMRLAASRLETKNTHGSGDTLSAAVCAYLARGATMPAAVTLAHAFTQRAIKRAAGWRLGRGHGPVAPGRLSV